MDRREFFGFGAAIAALAPVAVTAAPRFVESELDRLWDAGNCDWDRPSQRPAAERMAEWDAMEVVPKADVRAGSAAYREALADGKSEDEAIEAFRAAARTRDAGWRNGMSPCGMQQEPIPMSERIKALQENTPITA